jgi:hypothetical protein
MPGARRGFSRDADLHRARHEGERVRPVTDRINPEAVSALGPPTSRRSRVPLARERPVEEG